MEVIELSAFWEKLLQITSKKMDARLWESSIHSGLLPITLENNILTLGVMQDYIKNFIEKNPIIYGTLKSSAEELYGAPLVLSIISLMPPTEIPSTSETTTSAYNSFVEPTASIEPEETIEYSSPIDSSIPPKIDDIIKDLQEEAKKESIAKDIPNEFSYPSYDTPVIIDHSGFNTPHYEEPVVLSSAPNVSSDIYVPSQDKQEVTTPELIGQQSNSRLNTSFTFDTFVTGNSNRVAFSAAQYVAEQPAERYNPLFIYGQSGLGKTHLMHAIGNGIIEKYPHLKVMCITSEKFTNIFINSLKDKRSESFRNTFRNIDVLLVDDIQFLQNKESTQEEFFHTFNTLYDDKKQIILTSDMLPKDMKQMENRLRSRFEAGFIVKMEPPDLETRIAILRSIIDKEMKKNPSLQIPNEVINYIASIFDKNVRILQGAFTRLIGAISLEHTDTPITMDYARQILADLITETDKPILSVAYIQDFIASYFKIKKEDLLGQKRNKQFAYPRQIAMYLCRELINESYPQISLAFGKKDHTTTLHAYEKISKEIANNKETKRLIDEIKTKIQG